MDNNVCDFSVVAGKSCANMADVEGWCAYDVLWIGN